MPTSKIPRYDEDLVQRVKSLEAEVQRAISETRVASELSVRNARVLRTSAKGRWDAEAQAGWARLTPPAELMKWTPRQATVEAPDVAQSLIDRLRRGDPVADTLGNVDPYSSLGNGLLDPTFETIPEAGEAPWLTTSWQALSDYWEARYVLDSGVAPQNVHLYIDRRHDDPLCNFNSDSVEVWIETGLGAGQITVELRPTDPAGGIGYFYAYWPAPPYVVAGIKIDPYPQAIGWTARYGVDLCRYNPSGPSWSIMATTWTDVYAQNYGPVATRREIHAPYLNVSPFISSHGWYPVYKYQVGYPALYGASWNPRFGEPQIHAAWSPDPLPYSPMLGKWYPRRVIDLTVEGHVEFDGIGTLIASTSMGGGGPQMGVVTPNYSTAIPFRAGGLYVGSNYGDAEPYTDGIQFGADTNLYRAGAGVLGTDGSLVVGGIVQGDGEGWTSVANFQNGWGNYGGGWPSARYRLDAMGWMHVSGLVSGGTSGTIAFTVPSPDGGGLHFPALSNTGYGEIRLGATGGVQLNGGNGFFSVEFTYRAG